MGNTDKQFVRYPTEICEALCVYHLSPIQFNVVNYIIRKTYGWNKTKDYISVSMMAKEIGRRRSAVSGAVNELRKKGVIGSDEWQHGRACVMWINPPDAWEKPVTFSEHVTKLGHVTKYRQGMSRNHDINMSENRDVNMSGNHDTQYTYKDNIKNINKKKEPPASFPEDDEDETTTLFGGRITIAEFKRLPPEEQEAMDREYWGE